MHPFAITVLGGIPYQTLTEVLGESRMSENSGDDQANDRSRGKSLAGGTGDPRVLDSELCEEFTYVPVGGVSPALQVSLIFLLHLPPGCLKTP